MVDRGDLGTHRGGRHILYAVASPAPSTKGRLGEGIDTRGRGGYIVLPPALHISGWRRSPETHPIVPAPPWLVEALSKVRPRGGKRGGRKAAGRDQSCSGADRALCLRMLREDDDATERELHRTSRTVHECANADAYVALTMASARRIHEESAPRATALAARLDHYLAHYGKAALTRVRLDVRTDDGEAVRATVVVPSEGYRSAGVPPSPTSIRAS